MNGALTPRPPLPLAGEGVARSAGGEGPHSQYARAHTASVTDSPPQTTQRVGA